MKFAPIVPIKYNPAQYTTHHMILAHELMEDAELFAYYKALGPKHTIILDNGVVERGQPVGVADLLGLLVEFDKCDADLIIVAPDVIGNEAATVQLSTEFVKELTVKYNLVVRHNRHLMIVPQGRSPIQWLICLRQLAKLLDEDDYVGLPRVTEDWPGGRQHLYIGAGQFNLWEGKFWLLGIQHKLSEIGWVLNWKPYQHHIVGVDSSLPYGAGIQGQRAIHVQDYRKLNRGDEDRQDGEYDLTDANIVECVRYCDGKVSRMQV